VSKTKENKHSRSLILFYCAFGISMPAKIQISGFTRNIAILAT
jgi:hypothetical protein